MPNKRISTEKRTLVLMALCEGMPVRACARMYRTGKSTITRVIRETGEALADYMDENFRGLTTSHIERAFLTVRQELKRFQRRGLGYSKDLATHKAAVALHFGVYNFVRRHTSLGTAPAVAAGI